MRASVILISLALLFPHSVIASKKHTSKQPASDEQPDAELLEFIAEFEPLDGQWVDPIQLNMIFAQNREGKENE